MMKRVLIVDDNVYVRDLVHTFLKDAPEIEICGEAINGIEGIEKAKQLKADVVLLDLSMPNMNGVETASILKKTIPGVCVIMFTMYSENIPKNAISSIGVDVVLSKTDGIAHLVESINTIFAARAGSHTPLNPA
jgi:two-component system nitrate/nitrite response regulator NarL